MKVLVGLKNPASYMEYTWYMCNTVLTSSITSILLFKIKSLSHHYIHTSHLNSSF